MNEETIADVVASMRGRAEDGRADRALWRLYAGRVEAAAAQREAFWIERVKAAMEVADQFKSTLEHVLDGLMFAKQEKVKRWKI